MNRRDILRASALAGVVTLASVSCSQRGSVSVDATSSAEAKSPASVSSSPASPPDARYAAQVDEGLRYFQEQAQRQIPLVEALLKAVQGSDLEKAKQVYVASRTPYEQIEVLAASFADTDTAIDARPYAFEQGEADPEFMGFHRIEALIYRDGDLKAAVPYAEKLLTSAKTLINDLQERQNFNAQKHFEGMITLATEVAAKKISSEEETWSDQSLLIFRDNWDGIYSQFQPFATLLEAKDAAAAKAVTDAYRQAQATVAPFFRSGQVGASPYSQTNMVQRGAIVRASYQLRDSLIKAMDVLELA